jgi:hypothetical protein
MSVAPSSQPPAVPKLPPYEPPKFPLRADAALSANRLRKHEGLRYLRDALDRSADLLTECADAVNNLVAEREAAARKATEGEDGEEDEELGEWRGQVDELTNRMERAVRRAIDARHEVEGCEEILRDATERVGRNSNQLPTAEALLASQAVPGTQRSGRRRRAATAHGDDDDDDNENEEDDEDEDVAMTGTTAPERPAEFAPSLFWEDQLKVRKDRYEAQPLRARYSEHNRYVAFKNAVWVARHPGGESVPHASTWFRAHEAGSPAPGTAPATVPGADEDGSDDDLQTIRVKISTKCPLSLVEMRDPASNRKCAHAFERETIEKYIRQNRRRGGGAAGQAAGAACPVAGCDKTLLLEDLYTDVALVRNVRRLQEAKLREDEGEAAEAVVEGEEQFEEIDTD